MSHIVDSGQRRQFETGATRDITDGKGRCDLLPLDVVGEIMGDQILLRINTFIRTGSQEEIKEIIKCFALKYFPDFETAMLEVAIHYEDGARKYSDRNWEKGVPLHSFIDSGVRHYLKFMRGDKDERHDRAFLWNMLGTLWTYYNHPDLIDLPFREALPFSPSLSQEKVNR